MKKIMKPLWNGRKVSAIRIAVDTHVAETHAQVVTLVV